MQKTKNARSQSTDYVYMCEVMDRSQFTNISHVQKHGQHCLRPWPPNLLALYPDSSQLHVESTVDNMPHMEFKVNFSTGFHHGLTTDITIYIMQGNISSWTQVTTGIPQGLVSWPVLIFINNLDKQVLKTGFQNLLTIS